MPWVLQKQPPGGLYEKNCSYKFLSIKKENTCAAFLFKQFDLQLFKNETPAKVCFYEYCEITKNTYFEGNLPTIAFGS